MQRVRVAARGAAPRRVFRGRWSGVPERPRTDTPDLLCFRGLGPGRARLVSVSRRRVRGGLRVCSEIGIAHL